MPYAPHSHVVTPPDEMVIWRYMPLWVFDKLLSGGLWFCRTDLFRDPCEGAVPLPNWQAARDSSLSLESQNQVQRMLHSFENYRENSFVNCWRIAETEDVNIWEAYNGEVVIRSTIARMKQSMAEIPDEVYIGTVGYPGLETGYFGRTEGLVLNVFDPIVNKEPDFAWEQEVRAIILNPEHLTGHPRPDGITCSTNLSELISEVRFAANTPDETINHYRPILAASIGSQLQLIRSECLRGE